MRGVDRLLLTRALTDLLEEEAALDERRQIFGEAVEAVGRVLGLPAPVTLDAVRALVDGPAAVDVEPGQLPPPPAKAAKPSDEVVLAALAELQPCRPGDLVGVLGQPNAQSVYWMLHRLQKRHLVSVTDAGDWRCVTAAAEVEVEPAVAVPAPDLSGAVVVNAPGFPTLPSDGDDAEPAPHVAVPAPAAPPVPPGARSPLPAPPRSTSLDPDLLLDLVLTYGEDGIVVSAIIELLPWAVRSRLSGNMEVHQMLEQLAAKGFVERGRAGRWAPGPNVSSVEDTTPV